MNADNATQLLPPLAWRDPRIHMLDDTWLLTIFTVLFSTAVPWLVSGLAIDYLPVAAALIGLGAIHVVLALLASRGPADSARRARVLASLHALGVIALAYIWHHAGGLQNPLFLAVFVLPIIGAVFLSRWQPYLVAALSAIAVGLIAALEAPELRWYAPGLGAALGWAESVLGRSTVSGAQPFGGFYAPAGYFVVLLEVFVVMVFACAVAAEYLGALLERLRAQVSAARMEAERSQRLWEQLLEAFPLPAFLLDADTFEVCYANAAASSAYSADQGGFLGRSFFEALSFSYPELVTEMVSGAGGVARSCMLRLHGRLLATEVRVQHVADDGRRFALVIVQDATEAFCIQAALDVAEHAAVVLDAHGRVLAHNKPAAVLFPEVHIDAEFERLMPEPERALHWWEPGLSGRRKMHLTIRQHVYQLTSSTVPLPGEDERLYVLAFLPAAQFESQEQKGGELAARTSRP